MEPKQTLEMVPYAPRMYGTLGKSAVDPRILPVYSFVMHTYHPRRLRSRSQSTVPVPYCKKADLKNGGYFGGGQRHITPHYLDMVRRVPVAGGLDLLPVADLAGVAPLAHKDVLLLESLRAVLEVVLHRHHVAFAQHLGRYGTR